MSASNSSTVALALVVLACVPTLSCKKASPGAYAPAPDEKSSSERSDPLAELDRLEQQMQALGLSVARAEAPAAPDADEGAGDALSQAEAEFSDDHQPEPTAVAPSDQRRSRAEQCENICDLSFAICDLQGQICSLSESHGGDPTYANACRRASDDCEVAGYECDRCAAG